MNHAERYERPEPLRPDDEATLPNTASGTSAMIQCSTMMIRSKADLERVAAPLVFSAASEPSRRQAKATAMMITPMTLFSTSGRTRLVGMLSSNCSERVARRLSAPRRAAELRVLAGANDIRHGQADEDRDEGVQHEQEEHLSRQPPAHIGADQGP